MSDVALLWFKCKNPDCGYVEKLDRKLYKEGKIRSQKQIVTRGRYFMRYVEGHRIFKGEEIFFDCRYGLICTFSNYQSFNSYLYTINDKEMCNPCLQKIANEERLFS